MLILAAAVFAWGLQYKLSLYEAPSHSHPVSVAKLIQGEQTNKKSAAIQVRIRDWSSAFSLDSNLQTFRPPVVRRNRQADKLVRPSIMFFPSLLFFRPPPQAS